MNIKKTLSSYIKSVESTDSVLKIVFEAMQTSLTVEPLNLCNISFIYCDLVNIEGNSGQPLDSLVGVFVSRIEIFDNMPNVIRLKSDHGEYSIYCYGHSACDSPDIVQIVLVQEQYTATIEFDSEGNHD